MREVISLPTRLLTTLALLLSAGCGAAKDPAHGTVHLAGGSPARSTTVLLLDRAGLTIATTTTDDTGGYSFECAIPAGSRVHARANHRGTARSEPLSEDSLPAVLTLNGSTRLAGTLLDRSGRPLPHQSMIAISAKLLASDVMPKLDRYLRTQWHPTRMAHIGEGDDGLACSQAQTDAKGRFRFSSLCPGQFVIAGACFLDRRVSDPQEYLLASGVDDARIFADLCRLDLEVVQPNGKPYRPSSHTRIEGIGGASCFATTSDANGSLVVRSDRFQRLPLRFGKAQFWVATGDHYIAVTVPAASQGTRNIVDRRVIGVMLSIDDDDSVRSVRLELAPSNPPGQLSIKAGKGSGEELFIADATTGIRLHPSAEALPIGKPFALAAGRYLLGEAVVEVIAGRTQEVTPQVSGG